MPSKGFNSVLFDFFSLVDKQISLLNWLTHEYNPKELRWLKEGTWHLSSEHLEFARMNGYEDLFKVCIQDPDIKFESDTVLNDFFDKFESEILKYAHTTSLTHLVSAYKTAGNGTIQTAIRCSNEAERDFVINNISKNANTFISSIEDTDMKKYARLIVGDIPSALAYRYTEPKSILIVNFRENFTESNINILRPELVINLGDIHDIQVVFAYKMDIQPEG